MTDNRTCFLLTMVCPIVLSNALGVWSDVGWSADQICLTTVEDQMSNSLSRNLVEGKGLIPKEPFETPRDLQVQNQMGRFFDLISKNLRVERRPDAKQPLFSPKLLQQLRDGIAFLVPADGTYGKQSWLWDSVFGAEIAHTLSQVVTNPKLTAASNASPLGV